MPPPTPFRPSYEYLKYGNQPQLSDLVQTVQHGQHRGGHRDGQYVTQLKPLTQSMKIIWATGNLKNPVLPLYTGRQNSKDDKLGNLKGVISSS